jgi:integrase
VSARRSYGTGELYARADSAGRESWYGRWRSGGQRVKRCIGPKRVAGTRDGLTRAQAESELRRLQREVKPTPRINDHRTLAEVGELYVAHLERQGRKKSTVTGVRCALTNWLVPLWGDRALDRVKAEDVADLIRMMEEGRRPRDGARRVKPVGPKSIRNYVGTLSALYRFAMHPRRRWAGANPCDGVDLPAVPEHDDIRFLEPDEVRVLSGAAVESEYQAVDRSLYLTAAMTGLRQGELLALRWRDVDWLASRVRVRQNYVLGEYGTPKSKRSTRSVPLAPEVGGELDRLFKASARQGDDDLVFGDPLTGEPLQRAALMRRYRRALNGAKLDPTTRFHDLRHTFGTRMAAQGVAMRTLQEWMGHRDIETTQRYADYAPSPHEADLVAAAFESTEASANPVTIGKR